jgi:RHS repeat-associated protein
MIALNKNINTPVIASLKTTNSSNNGGNSANAISYLRYNDIIGNKYFELSNHLGNVLVALSDRKTPQYKTTGIAPNTTTTFSYFKASILSATDYYPFGMAMPGRQVSTDKYRYGFNGKEKDKNINSGAVAFEARIYDSRIGRFFSVDPMQEKFPNETPYMYAGDNPITLKDIEGKYKFIIHLEYDPKTKSLTILRVEKQEGIKSKVIHSSLGHTPVDHYEWYNYVEYNVTVAGAPNEVYVSNFTSPHIVGNVLTTTDVDWEWYADAKISDYNPNPMEDDGKTRRFGLTMTTTRDLEDIVSESAKNEWSFNLDKATQIESLGNISDLLGIFKNWREYSGKEDPFQFIKGEKLQRAFEGIDNIIDGAASGIDGSNVEPESGILKLPNSTYCPKCNGLNGEDHGDGLLLTNSQGIVIDTLKRNHVTGKTDTVPVKTPPIPFKKDYKPVDNK